jgi:hypothetical protein
MKYWDVNSVWLNKSTGQKINKCFVVLNNGEDPLDTIVDKIDMEGFTYVGSEVQELTEPFAVNYYSAKSS